MRKKLTLLTILLSGCALRHATINSYVEPTYTAGGIKRLAVFSIRNAGRAPSEARDLNAKLTQAIAAKNPEIDIVAPSAALKAINDAGLADLWADFVEDYYTSGIANKEHLAKISKALGVDGIMQGQLVNVWQQDGNGLMQGQTRVTINFSIIESSSAKQVWEATADGIRGNASASSVAPPIADALELALKKITDNVPLL